MASSDLSRICFLKIVLRDASQVLTNNSKTNTANAA